MNDRGILDPCANTAIAEATSAALLGDAVRINDDLYDGGSVTMTAAGRRHGRRDGAVAVALPRWRALGPLSLPAEFSTIHRVPDLGLLVDASLATASVDLLRLVGADPVALHLSATVAPSAQVELSSVLHAWCARALTVRHMSQARMPTAAGEFEAHVIEDVLGRQHVMMAMGKDPGVGPHAVLSECVLGMAMRSLGCGCRARLHDALRTIGAAGTGTVMLVRAGLSELAAPGGCERWSAADPAVGVRHRALAEAALASVRAHPARRPERRSVVGVAAAGA